MNAQNKNKNKNKTAKQIANAASKITKAFRTVQNNNRNKIRQNHDTRIGVPIKINQFREYPQDKLQPALAHYHKFVRSRYLFGLCHPDIAVKDGIPVKMYSDVPIPTTSIGYHIQTQFSTSSIGTFLCSWRPNLMVTPQQLAAQSSVSASNFTYNNSSTLTGNTAVSGNIFQDPGYYPNSSFQRYRLVSALMKVRYNGSVLDQAGTLISCCTFDPLQVASGSSSTPVNTFSDGLVDRFGQFSLIANGLWNTEINITKDSEGLECMYVPMDPDDFVFQRNGTYMGTQLSSAGLTSPQTEGASIQYVVAGRNMPAGKNCVIVDWYYNYEVIADPSAAALFKSDINTTLTKKDHDNITSSISQVAKEQGFIRKSSDKPTWPAVVDKIITLGATYLPKMLGAIM